MRASSAMGQAALESKKRSQVRENLEDAMEAMKLTFSHCCGVGIQKPDL